MSEKKYCFMHAQTVPTVRIECVPQCMAYRVREGYDEPICVVLEVGDAFIGTLVGWARMQQKTQERSVEHGQSAPPPEVT